MKKTAILLPLCVLLIGCGFSPDYWRTQLTQTSDIEVCAASIDPRGAGWAVRKQAALELIKSKRISCDYNLAVQVLQTQIATNNAQLAASASMMQAGTAMIAAGQPRQTWTPAPVVNTSCRTIGQTLNCQSY